jgi:uncharacterized protein YndB with AHSA1/START domain
LARLARSRLREVHHQSGGFTAKVSRTLAATPEAVFAEWKDGRRRTRWLKEPTITIRRATEPKSLRITWSDGESNVEVNVYAKSGGKSQLTVQHSKLKNEKDVAGKKKFWAEALERLEQQIAAVSRK